MNLFQTRRSTRIFDKNHKIPKKILEKIIEETIYAPSAFNLQPWHFFIIESSLYKDKLSTCLYGNRTQLDTSSAMVLICGNINKKELKQTVYNKSNINNIFHKSFNLLSTQKEKIFNNIDKCYNSMSQEEIKNELFLEVGIVSLQFMLVAKKYNYDTCPIGGFNKKKINTVLNINLDYIPILLVAIGKKIDNSPNNFFRLKYDKLISWL